MRVGVDFMTFSYQAFTASYANYFFFSSFGEKMLLRILLFESLKLEFEERVSCNLVMKGRRRSTWQHVRALKIFNSNIVVFCTLIVYFNGR